MRGYEEIKERVNLCDDKGDFNDIKKYWSREPIINCNIHKKYKFRVKRWNYWTISNEKYFFTIAVTNFDYAGVIFVYLVNMEEKNIIEKYISIPLGKNIFLGDNLKDDFKFSNKDIDLKSVTSDNGNVIKVYVKNLKENNDLQGELTIEKPKECLNLIVPWSKNRFQFTSKQNCLKVSGTIKFGDEIIDFNDESSLATLDFGRGVWKRKMMWNWLSFSSLSNNRLIGGNLGCKWTDGSGVNENALFLDEKVFKLKEEVEFIYDSKDLCKKWRIKNKEGTVELEFYPEVKRYKNVNAFVVKSNFRQLFGKLYGKLIIGDEKISIDGINATCEEHVARW